MVLQTRNTFHLQSLPVIEVGVAAGNDVQDFLFGGDLGDRGGDAGIDVADHEVDLIPLDQLARLLHAGADVVGGIFHQQFDLPPENAAFGVDLLDGELGSHHLVAGRRGIDAGERIDHADPDRRLAARGDDKGRRHLEGPERGGAGHERAAV